MRAANSFSRPDEVHPAAHQASVEGGSVRLTVPRQSVVALQVQLA